MLHGQEERRAERRESEERRAYLVGGVVTVAAGVGITVMLAAIGSKPGQWTVGLIPLLVGATLTLSGLLMKPGRRSELQDRLEK